MFKLIIQMQSIMELSLNRDEKKILKTGLELTVTLIRHTKKITNWEPFIIQQLLILKNILQMLKNNLQLVSVTTTASRILCLILQIIHIILIKLKDHMEAQYLHQDQTLYKLHILQL